MPHKFVLYAPAAEGTTICYSGMSREENAWVAREWLIDVAPETPVGKGWLKSRSRYDVAT